MKKLYRERANGRFEYWTYCDGQRVYLSETTALRELARQRPEYKLVNVK